MESITFHNLNGRSGKGPVSFGAPWKKGLIRTPFYRLTDGSGRSLPLQSRVTASWPDGSVKWSAHSCALSGCPPYVLTCDSKEGSQCDSQPEGLKITSQSGCITVDGGSVRAEFRAGGDYVIENLVIDGRLTASYGKLIYTSQALHEDGDVKTLTEEDYSGRADRVTVEEEGPVSCVIRLDGVHVHKGKALIPFIVRFTFTYNEACVKMMHTFLYDGDPQLDFMKAMGITFLCPLEGEACNRHIKLSGENGVFHEAGQLLVSWRPRLPQELYEQQSLGRLLDKESLEDGIVKSALKDIPLWNGYRLYQDSAGHYTIRKGTGKRGCCFIDALHGGRAGGVVGVYGEEGGLLLGMKDFWQKHPSSLWVEDLTGDNTRVTAWIWSCEHEAMDFRHYDTVGHASAYYEGFDEVGSTPFGIANTNELVLAGFARGIAEDSEVKSFEKYVQKPPMLFADPEYYHSARAFGPWSLIKKESPFESWLEKQLNLALDFYLKEIEQRQWYGLFHYGDVMHTYDRFRHCWRYDMGGFAWQNTELVPTLWLWYAFLRSGREEVFTLAEAMTRHCSEVDLYHMGDLKGLGSRHNVLHWGCSCKEPRIAMAGHHRFYYYLTGDYRLGDVFDEVRDGDLSTLHMDPLRHFYDKGAMVYPTHARTGPDWSSYCSNWLTAWERKGDTQARDKLLTGINDIKASPYGLISGSDYEYDPQSGHLRYIGENASGGSHLAICMGAPSVWFELAEVLEDEAWTLLLAEYGDFYFASPEEKRMKAPMVNADKGFAFPYMAAAMGAYAARYYKKDALGRKIWKTLAEELGGSSGKRSFEAVKVDTYANTGELSEIPWLSTNFTAQWCLNVILSMELAGEYMPQSLTEVAGNEAMGQ